ncbi:hypothetical protein D9M71_71590 [compost metagenome]
MSDLIPPLRIVLVLLIASESFWFANRLCRAVGFELSSLIPPPLFNLIGMLSSVLLILLFFFLFRLVGRLKL